MIYNELMSPIEMRTANGAVIYPELLDTAKLMSYVGLSANVKLVSAESVKVLMDVDNMIIPHKYIDFEYLSPIDCDSIIYFHMHDGTNVPVASINTTDENILSAILFDLSQDLEDRGILVAPKFETKLHTKIGAGLRVVDDGYRTQFIQTADNVHVTPDEVTVMLADKGNLITDIFDDGKIKFTKLKHNEDDLIGYTLADAILVRSAEKAVASFKSKHQIQ